MTVIDIFCGAGGLSLGFKQAGHKIICAVDNDFYACETFKLNFPETDVINRDVFELLLLPKADILIGSPPCQQYSKLKMRKKEDADNINIRKFFNFYEAGSFKYFCMENVDGAQLFIPEKYTKYIYYLQANHFGLYHIRKRLFVSNIPIPLNKTNNKKRYPTPTACDRDTRAKTKMSNTPQGLAGYFGYLPDPEISKKIMGFPYDYIFVGKKQERTRQIGNAVCPPIAKAIGAQLQGE